MIPLILVRHYKVLPCLPTPHLHSPVLFLIITLCVSIVVLTAIYIYCLSPSLECEVP